MFNPEYVEAAEVELGKLTFHPSIPVLDTVMAHLEKTKRMAPVVLEHNRRSRRALAYKESALRNIPRGHYTKKVKYPDI